MPTGNYNLPLIADNMANDVVRDMNALAEATDSALKGLGDDKANNTDLTTLNNKVTAHSNDDLTWQTLPPMNGWGGTISYARGSHNDVYLSIGISGGVKTTGTIIAELPAGYRPQFGIEFVATTITSQAAGDNVSIGIFISVNGGIQLDGLAKENVTGYGVFRAVKV